MVSLVTRIWPRALLHRTNHLQCSALCCYLASLLYSNITKNVSTYRLAVAIPFSKGIHSSWQRRRPAPSWHPSLYLDVATRETSPMISYLREASLSHLLTLSYVPPSHASLTLRVTYLLIALFGSGLPLPITLQKYIFLTVIHQSVWRIVNSQDAVVKGRMNWGHLSPSSSGRILGPRAGRSCSRWHLAARVWQTQDSRPSLALRKEASVPIRADHDLVKNLSPSSFSIACPRVETELVLKGTMLSGFLSPSLLSLSHSEFQWKVVLRNHIRMATG